MGATEKTAGRRAGLDAGKVADKALDLTAAEGVGGWSMRSLAAQLGVAPSVLYHYYPNRDALVDAVIHRAFLQLELPPDDLPWKEWFLECAKRLRGILLGYNGMADLLLLGRFPLSAVPMLEAAFGKLREAGFGDSAGIVYAMVGNVALGAIAGKDHRSPNERRIPHDLDAMLAGMGPMADASASVRGFMAGFLEPLSAHEDEGAGNELSVRYFDLVMRSILAGVEATLLPRGR